MKQSIFTFLILIYSLIFINNSEAHLIKLVNDSEKSNLLVSYEGQDNESIQVAPQKTDYLTAPDEDEGILTIKLLNYSLAGKKIIGETHLYTDAFDKVTGIKAEDEPHARILIYQGYADL